MSAGVDLLATMNISGALYDSVPAPSPLDVATVANVSCSRFRIQHTCKSYHNISRLYVLMDDCRNSAMHIP